LETSRKCAQETERGGPGHGRYIRLSFRRFVLRQLAVFFPGCGVTVHLRMIVHSGGLARARPNNAVDVVALRTFIIIAEVQIKRVTVETAGIGRADTLR